MNVRAVIRKSLALLVTISIVFIGFPSNALADTFEDQELRIVVNPTSVKLSPGQRTIVHISITNNNDQAENIFLDYIWEESFGGTHGDLSERFFQLQPNETHEVELELTASARWFRSENENDGRLEIYWGTGMNATSFRILDPETVDNSAEFSIEVTKDMTIPYTILLLTTIVLIVIAFIVIKRRKKKAEGSLMEETVEN